MIILIIILILMIILILILIIILIIIPILILILIPILILILIASRRETVEGHSEGRRPRHGKELHYPGSVRATRFRTNKDGVLGYR